MSNRTIEQNLTLLSSTKRDIRNAINIKGGSVSSATPFADYATAINNLPSGGGGEDLDWSLIGYSARPSSIDDAYAYSRQIYVDWDNTETDMSERYYQNKQIKYFPLVDTSNVTNMRSMFMDSALEYIPLLDTSNVTDMSNMLYGTKLTTIPQFNTSACTNMRYTFVDTNITSIPLLDTRNVETFQGTFERTKITTIPQLNTSAATNMSEMFWDCTNLTSIPLLDTSNAENMNYMFVNCTSLTDIPQLNTSACTSMYMMFNGCTGLTGFSALSGYDFTNVENCADMFSDCHNIPLTTLPVINTVNCTDFGSMLRFNSSALTRVEGIYLNSWHGGQIFGDWNGDPDSQQNHPNLTYVMLYNLGMSEYASGFDLACLMDWGDGGTANHQSLIDSLYTNAFDRATAGYETKRIYLHPYTYARLSQQEIDNIESKGYEVVDINNQ
jgi:Mycoplasma protein of unknown function, DUF285.